MKDLSLYSVLTETAGCSSFSKHYLYCSKQNISWNIFSCKCPITTRRNIYRIGNRKYSALSAQIIIHSWFWFERIRKYGRSPDVLMSFSLSHWSKTALSFTVSLITWQFNPLLLLFHSSHLNTVFEGLLKLPTPWSANKSAESWQPNILSDLYRLESVCITLSAFTQLLRTLPSVTKGHQPAAVWFHNRHWTLCLRIIQFQFIYSMLSCTFSLCGYMKHEIVMSVRLSLSPDLKFLDNCLMDFYEKFVKALTHYTDIKEHLGW